MQDVQALKTWGACFRNDTLFWHLFLVINSRIIQKNPQMFWLLHKSLGKKASPNNCLTKKNLGRNIPLFLPNFPPRSPSSHAVPPRCSIPSHLSCIKCKLQCTALTYAVEKGVWCSGFCPIFSWINTSSICRLADTVMFAFQGNLPPSLPSSSALLSQTQRWRVSKSLSTEQSTGICAHHTISVAVTGKRNMKYTIVGRLR